ncbi:MAG: hypothetical protein M1486_01600 [Gammaproteobacteria bacterium]|nr:hypothetical protein [Gammaproteobacteria bacterium]
MSTTYSSKIAAFKLIANHLELSEAVQQLTVLRLRSDLMEIIGHPKNPRNGFINDEANNLFILFRGQLSSLQNEILELVATHSGRDTAMKIAQICQEDQADSEKLAILADFLVANVPKTIDSLVMQP